MNERVVITGMGLICPMGHDVETVWQGILQGKNGIANTTVFDASTFPTKFGAEVKGYDVKDFTENPALHEKINRGTSFAIGATGQACKQAGIEIDTDSPLVVINGANESGKSTIFSQYFTDGAFWLCQRCTV